MTQVCQEVLQSVKVKDNMFLDKQSDADESACSLFLRQQCQKQQLTTQTFHALTYSSVCHYSYKTIINMCYYLDCKASDKKRKAE